VVTHSGGQTTTYTYNYPAAGSAQSHALQAVNVTGATTRTDTYAYDSAGLTTSRPGPSGQQTVTADAEGRIRAISDLASTTSNVYDADGNLLIQKSSSTSVLFDGPNTVSLSVASGTKTGVRRYTFGGSIVAERASSGAVSWLFGGQGTSSGAMDAASQVMTKRYFDPFGASRTAPVVFPTQFDFVGGFKSASTGLVHLGARDYDSSTGRFLAPDPQLDGSIPQQWSSYTYGLNNPWTYSDPTGTRPGDCNAACMKNWTAAKSKSQSQSQSASTSSSTGNGASDRSWKDTPNRTPTANSYSFVPCTYVPQPQPQQGMGGGALRTVAEYGLDGLLVVETVVNVVQFGVDPITDGLEVGTAAARAALIGGEEVAAESASVAVESAATAAESESVPVIVGENMRRVERYARKVGGTQINEWLAGRTWTPGLNDEFIAAMKQDGRDIVDIGPDFLRRRANRVDPTDGRPPSPIYGGERQQLLGYDRYSSVYQRWSKYQGGVPGFD
jgi:RHS repeat-associated protein